MSLKDWVNNGWLREHKTSKQEILNLLEIVNVLNYDFPDRHKIQSPYHSHNKVFLVFKKLV